MNVSKTGVNYVYSMLYRLSSCVLPLVVTPRIARVLGAENNGVYVITSVVACIFIMLCKLGLENYGNRAIAVARDDPKERSRVFCSIYALQLCASAISITVYVVMTACFIKEHQAVYWLQLLYVLSALFDVSWFFFGIEKFRLTTVRSLIARALIIAGVYVFVNDQNDLVVYTAVMSGCFLLEQCMLFPFVFKHVRVARPRLADVKRHIKPNLVLFIPILALSVYHWMDKIMLGAMVDTGTVAYYNYAESIINLPKGIVQALGTVMLPRISYLVARGRDRECAPLFGTSMELACVIGCALCFGIIGVAPVFVPLFLGPDYTPTILLTMELAIVMIPMSVADVIQTQHLIPFRRDIVYVWSIIIGACVNLMLNVCLIPPLKATGAIIGTLGAELAVCVYQLVRVRAFYPSRRLLANLLPYVLIGTASALATLALGGLEMDALPLMMVQTAVMGGSYLALCAIYFAVQKRLKPGYQSPINRFRKGMDARDMQAEGGSEP